MSIQNELDKIKNATYGRDVRDAIHDGIKQAYDDATKDHDNANMEVKLARGEFTTLSGRLNKIDFNEKDIQSILSNKAEESDTRRKDVDIGLSDVNSELLSAISGGTEVNVMSVPKDKSVDYKSTNFLSGSSNMFNKEKSLKGYTLDSLTGKPSPQSNFASSDFIRVQPQTTYTVNHANKFIYFDENKSYLSYSDGTILIDTIVIPEKCAFVRYVVRIGQIRYTQFNEGKKLLEYEEYQIKFDENENIKFPKLDVSNYHGIVTNRSEGVSIDWEKLKIHIKSDSLRLRHKDTSYLLKEQTIDIPKIGVFNLVYNIISDEVELTSTALDIPKGSFYFANIIASDKTIIGIDNYDILGNRPLPPDKEDKVIFEEIDKFVIQGDTKMNFTSEKMPTQQNYYYKRTSEELIALYDDLMLERPEYVKKSVIAVDESGKDIFRYDFTPKLVDDTANKTKFPTMILVGGVHGTERTGSWNLYQTLHAITMKWKESESLETLRWNVHFAVIPLVGNFNYDNGGRKNENGVDLARNFSAGWVLGADPESMTYGGTEPFSEKGSQAVRDLILDNKDAIYFGSYHSFKTPADPATFIWNASATTLQVNLGKTLVSKMSRKWKKEYPWLPQDDTTYFGYSNNQSPPGSESMYAASLGIQAGTFEICHDFSLEEGSEINNSMHLTIALETSINWLLLNLENNVNFYNNIFQYKERR